MSNMLAVFATNK